MAETVAFLFSDLAGSTGLLTDLGADAYGEVLSAYRDAVEKAAAEHEGEVVDREGDGIFLVFPTAAGAIRAAAGAQRSLAGTDWPDGASVTARMGVHVGEAQRHEDGWVGLDIHRAARVGSAAHGGQVVVSDTARALARDALSGGIEFRDLDEHRLEGLEHAERLHQLVAPGLAEDFPPLRTLEGVPNNLPVQPTSFIGRERELEQVVDLVRDDRLVTLTGVGGAGKTRLALEAAAQLTTAFRGGTWLVELGAITDAEAVPRQVATTLRVREHEDDEQAGTIQDRLVAHLREREALLVLDNCEHLLAGAARLCDRLLRDCPDLTVLATSREGLGIAGERLWQVPSLALPDPDAPEVEETDAVRLFAERARAVAPTFTLSDDTRPLVARICRRLDGIPLAIELAAARVRVLGLEGLAERLDDRFRVLTGGHRTALPRQQTLAATIDWSYELLDEAERQLFVRLAVFAGSFTLEAAEEICSGDGIDELDVLDLLTHLVDKSMVTPVEEAVGGVRYRLLETLRAYARDRLADAEAPDELRRRHRDHYLQLAERAEAHLHGPERRTWIGRVATERDNIRAALDWSLDQADDHPTAILAAALATHWHNLGHHQRALTHLRAALECTELDSEREAELRTKLAGVLYDIGEADAALEEAGLASDLVADAAPSGTKVRALARHAGMLQLNPGVDARHAIGPAREALAAARELGDPLTEFRALIVVGRALIWGIGETDSGIEHLREALEIARGHGEREAITRAYTFLIEALDVFARRGRQARTLADEALAWLDTTDERSGDTPDLSLLGYVTYVLLRSGEWPQVEVALERMTRSYHLEGFSQALFLQVRGSLRWMQGRLDEASSDTAELRALGIPRWNHDLFPLKAEIAALDGRLDDVREVVDEYLAIDTSPSEEAMKTAVLRPLVHAEVDAALRCSREQRDEHVRRGREALQRMKDIDERFPPPPPIQFELPDTSIAFAESELSRATGPDPDLWRTAHDQAYYRYWQLYARWRLAEALLAVGERDEGDAVLRETHDEAAEIGAGLIRDELEALAEQHRIGLRAADAATSGEPRAGEADRG